MNQQIPRTSAKATQIPAGNPAGETATAAAPPNVADLVEAGLAQHRAGRVTEAETLYLRVLAAAPGHADALHLLGVIAYQVGRRETAIERISQAIQQNGNNPAYHINLGLALQSLWRIDEALDSYNRALTLEPDNVEALNNRGLLLQQLERFEEALASFDRALSVRPDYVKALNNRGNTLQALQRLDEAIATYDRALALEPDLAEASHNRAEALRDLQRGQLPTERRIDPQVPRSHARSPAADPLELLESMYRNEPQLGSDGQLHAFDRPDVRIPREEGELLVQLHTMLKPQRTLEVGLGYGFSTMFFLMAMQQSGAGHHIALDPYQSMWHGIGTTRAELLKMQERFTLIAEESSLALPRLAVDKLQAQLIFIDGDHRFDSVLVDFYLSDKICALQGVIVFDDMWMPSVQRLVRFISNNRSDYRYIKTSVQNAAVFTKVGRDERRWDHYTDF